MNNPTSAPDCPCCHSRNLHYYGNRANCLSCNAEWFPDRVRAAAPSPAVADGWQLVPKEPTPEMWRAAWAALPKELQSYNARMAFPEQYRAALAASQAIQMYAPPPAAPLDEAAERARASDWVKENAQMLSYLSDPSEGYRLCWLAAVRGGRKG